LTTDPLGYKDITRNPHNFGVLVYWHGL